INMSAQTSPSSTSLDLATIAVIADPTDLYGLSGMPGDGNVFDSMEISGGYYGIYLTGSSSYHTISHSIFKDQYVASVFCSSQSYVNISHNDMGPLRNTAFSYSVNLSQVSNFQVYSNKI